MSPARTTAAPRPPARESPVAIGRHGRGDRLRQIRHRLVVVGPQSFPRAFFHGVDERAFETLGDQSVRRIGRDRGRDLDDRRRLRRLRVTERLYAPRIEGRFSAELDLSRNGGDRFVRVCARQAERDGDGGSSSDEDSRLSQSHVDQSCAYKDGWRSGRAAAKAHVRCEGVARQDAICVAPEIGLR